MGKEEGRLWIGKGVGSGGGKVVRGKRPGRGGVGRGKTG